MSMGKRDIMNAIAEIAFAAELVGDTDLNAKAFGAASWQLRQTEGDFAEHITTGALDKRRDLGKQVKEAVKTLFETGAYPLLDEMKTRVPAGLFDVRRVKGLGPKKIHKLWNELDITSLAELEYACHENRLKDLKGFGQKTQDKVLAGILEVRKYLGRFRRDQAAEALAPLLERLDDDHTVAFAEVVGQLAAGEETIDAADILIVAEDEAAVRAELAQPADGDEQAGDGDEDNSSPLAGPVPVTLHFCTPAQRGHRLVWLTADDAHRSALAAHAQTLGLQLDDSGLHREGAALNCVDDDAFYSALDLLTTAPERRHAGVPLVHQGQPRPALVVRGDIVGTVHNHTTESDGKNTLDEMADAAAALGHAYIGITEHSQSAAYAGGLPPAALTRQRGAVDSLNAASDGFVVLHGVESDIKKDGELDYDDDVLAALDIVIASVHQRYSATPEEMTSRMVNAAKHPYSDIIGHPTGRLLLGRAPSVYDVGAMLDACAESGTAVELNCNPARLDLSAEHLATAKERGVMISISADAHSTRGLGDLEYGLTIARRAGLGPDDLLNTLSADALSSWVQARRQRAGV